MGTDAEFTYVLESRLDRLQKKYLQGESSARATLAHLRRALGKEPGSIPEVWKITAVPASDYDNDAPSYAENAAHWIFTLYAHHQQSQTQSMFAQGKDTSLGRAVWRLSEDVNKEGVKKRFQAAASASTLYELGRHLMALIAQLRSAHIQLDYVQLYRDLLRFQQPGGRKVVQRRWARDYVAMSAQSLEDKKADI